MTFIFSKIVRPRRKLLAVHFSPSPYHTRTNTIKHSQMVADNLASTNETLCHNIEELKKQNKDTVRKNKELKEQLALLMKRVDAITNKAPVSSEPSTQIPI